MSFSLRSATNKKAIIVNSYEEAQALRVLCEDKFNRVIEIEGEIPDEFDITLYTSFYGSKVFVKTLKNGKKHCSYDVDLLILGLDLANFESLSYNALLEPYIASNTKLVEQYRAGFDKALNALVGKFLSNNKGHDPKIIKNAFIEMLS